MYNVFKINVFKFLIIVFLFQLFLCVKVLAVDSNNNISPTSVKITNSPGQIIVGNSIVFKTVISPSNATDSTVYWTSSDNNILKIDKNGLAVAKKAGTVKVVAKTKNGKTDSISVTVKNSSNDNSSKDIKSISLVKNSKEMLVGQTQKLKVSISPKGATNSNLTFSSSNPKVLEVDENGRIKAVGKGSAYIRVKTSNGKRASIKITVKNFLIKLDKNNVKVYNNDSFELIAMIIGSNFDEDSAKWKVTSAHNLRVVESVKLNYNTYKVKVLTKNPGNSKVVFSIDDSSVSADVDIVNTNNLLECPTIRYDTSNNDKIKVDVRFNSKPFSWSYYVSNNKKTGVNAEWVLKNNNLSDDIVLESSYTDVQGKIRVFDNKNNYRDCFTAPFDINNLKNSNTDISYTPNIKCPSLYEDSVIKMDDSLEQYKINMYGNRPLNTNVKQVFINILPTNDKVQYSWYTNKNNVTNSISIESSWQLYKTFSGKLTVPMTTSIDNYYERQGLITAMDDEGNIRLCYTDLYSPLQFKTKKTIGTTDIYVEKTYSYDSDQMINIINNLPDYYRGSPNIVMLSEDTYNKIVGTSCGVTNSVTSRIYVRDGKGCSSDYAKRAVVHELGHSMDSMYSKITGKKIADRDDVIKLFNNYSNIYQDGSYKYLRDYSYTSIGEFWADDVSIHYLNVNDDFKDNSDRDKWKVDENLINLKDGYLTKLSKFLNKYDKLKNVYR